MRKITAAMLMALGLLVGPTFMGTTLVGGQSSVQAEGIGIRVYDRDHDWDDRRGWWWRHRHHDWDDWRWRHHQYHDWD